MRKSELHTFTSGYIGNAPINNEEPALYPIGTAPKGHTTPDENMEFLIRRVDESEILLPSEFNGSAFIRPVHPSERTDEEALYPAGINPNNTCLDCD